MRWTTSSCATAIQCRHGKDSSLLLYEATHNRISSVWDFYAIQMPELSLKRAALFVRIMVVDSQPFLSQLTTLLHNEDWEIR
jgi:hypothetical protein